MGEEARVKEHGIVGCRLRQFYSISVNIRKGGYV
jgi:hypothetical protein